MWSVANRIDYALQIGFSISRIGLLLVIKLLRFLLTPSSIPGLEQKKTQLCVLMSLGMSLSDLLTQHSVLNYQPTYVCIVCY